MQRSGIMYVKATTLDDLLEATFQKLLKSKVRVVATKGANVELTGVALELTQPRARLSRTDTKGHVFSCLGEVFWYLSASSNADHIRFYIKMYEQFVEKDGTIHGGYGPRIFGGAVSQYERIVRMLRKNPSSRQAVIQIFDSKDIRRRYKDTPCTCTLQFFVRDGVISMVTHMRSNDAYMGLPHDVFAFTFIQELMARDLGCAVGTYKHLVGSLHLYDSDIPKVDAFLSEGLQPIRPMPAMPAGNQWDNVRAVLQAERSIRTQLAPTEAAVSATIASLPDYWADIVRLFAIHRLTRDYAKSRLRGNSTIQSERDTLREVAALRKAMSTNFYSSYIRKRTSGLPAPEPQMDLMQVVEVLTDAPV